MNILGGGEEGLSGAFGRFRLGLQGGQGDLSGVKELTASALGNSSDDHAVRGAGDEVADTIAVGEDGHSSAVGCARFLGGSVLVVARVSVEGALPGCAAAADSGLGAGSFGGGRAGEREGFGRGQRYGNQLAFLLKGGIIGHGNDS